MSETPAWLVCPNDPPCPHLGLLHDVESFDEPLPRCCADGCDCGKPVTDPTPAETLTAAADRLASPPRAIDITEPLVALLRGAAELARQPEIQGIYELNALRDALAVARAILGEDR